MIRLQGKLPRYLYVAVSGGVDSMAALAFLRKNHRVCAVFFHHGTENSDRAAWFLRDFAKDRDISFLTGSLTRERNKDESQEEYWRNERYAFFKSIGHPLVTAHHLDDCVETWIMTSLHGCGKIIPYRHANVIRPFRLTSKAKLIDYVNRHKIPFIVDDSNLDTAFDRNYIRHTMMPHVLRINPGIAKVIAKKINAETIDNIL
jgi:tRNA(Ile)-lysidine synthase